MEKQDCNRGQDLTSWLYGEATEEETRDLEQHLRQCPQCKDEATAFRYVRNSIHGWRSEMLRLPSFAPVQVTRPSAAAALREFFALAPIWLKGAVAVASLTLLFLAGTILMQPKQSAPVLSSDSKVSEQELAQIVEERLQERLREMTNTQSASGTTADKPKDDHMGYASRRKHSGASVAKTVKQKRSHGPLTRAEREQLAADLRLTWESDDADLDLLEDKLSPPED
ncbi:MAG TPA: zf-HC2 domain-containing protein [Pyrinomonadaceae bacterium]|nr:zf-HC2 domain-containing protein [Pyrinomonadaceae bacterium]